MKKKDTFQMIILYLFGFGLIWGCNAIFDESYRNISSYFKMMSTIVIVAMSIGLSGFLGGKISSIITKEKIMNEGANWFWIIVSGFIGGTLLSIIIHKMIFN